MSVGEGRIERALRLVRGVVQAVFAAVVVAGVTARIAGMPLYVAESGDEWGNMVTSLRVVYDRGDPCSFIHPALYYDVTAAAYALVFGVVRALHLADGAPTMTDLFLRDDRIFVYTARAVSVVSAVAALVVIYRFATWLWSRNAGWIAAALLAVLPSHVLYAKTVRVDSLFTALFLYASWRVLRLLDERGWRAETVAAASVGLATAANYNGGLLVFWLVAALSIRRGEVGEGRGRRVLTALAVAGLVFLACNPFALLNASAFATDAFIQARLAAAVHPGWEGRDALFYVRDLLQVSPILSALVLVSALAFAALGARRERFLLSIPLLYVVLFSAMRTREDRFILPALALLLLLVGGLPSLLLRRLATWPRTATVLAGLCVATVLAAIVGMAPAALMVPQPRPHQNLPRFEDGVLNWIEANAPPESTVLVESGVVPLLDTLKEPSRFAAALRRSLVATRPRLDLHYVGAVFRAGCNYDPGMVTRGEIDYAVISARNVQYIEQHCDEFAAVCAFYEALREHADLVVKAPEGFEPVGIYALRGR